MSHQKIAKLGEWAATAVCGNDILSSCLYVSGIAVGLAGIWAPLVLLFVGLVLWLYKHVYTEVVEALPVNGGAYNCLLNGTSKTLAAVAGVMTFLSYVATAVISAKVGIDYLGRVFMMPAIPATVGLLLVFAILVAVGIKDSAKVAMIIFAGHILTLLTFVILGGIHIFGGGQLYFMENIVATRGLIAGSGLLSALVLGFSASLLGVSGFESSANFVEEQKPGVFRKTLRNMFLGVLVFNPMIAIVSLAALPYHQISAARDFLLAAVATQLGGPIFSTWVSIDAFLVLSGAVLTAYVGVSGLLARMTEDGCLPSFLAKKSKNGSYIRIIFTFFALCTSILVMTRGNLLSLAGVYTVAFLGVMSLFALGNLILKETRTELKRTYSAPVIVVFAALVCTLVGMGGNIILDKNNLLFFGTYFLPVIVLVGLAIYKDYVLRFLIKLTQKIPSVNIYLKKNFEDMAEGKFVVFVHHVSRLYQVLDYINKNETGRNITIVHSKLHHDEHHNVHGCDEIQDVVNIMQKAGVFPHLKINYVCVKDQFGPAMIGKMEKQLKVRRNRMFMGSLHHYHTYGYEDLGGVRIVW